MNLPLKASIAPLLATFLLISCGSSQEPETRDSAVYKGEDSNTFVDKPVTPIDSATSDPVEEPVPEIPDHSPEGLKIGQYYASEDNEYSFCPDGRVKYDYSPDEIKTGTWTMKGDSVIMTYTLHIGRKGIGDPLPPPPGVPGNYIDRYAKYERFENKIHERDAWLWSEVKALMKENPRAPYEIIAVNVTCESYKNLRGENQ